MALQRAGQISREAVPFDSSAWQSANESKPWSRRAWPREQLRANWPHLTLQQVELLKEVFQLFDTEDKGYFTKDDLFFVMEAMGGSPTPQELDAVMYELDSNGDFVVDFPEFLTKFLTATDEKELLSVFNQLAIQEGEGSDERVLTLTAVERSFQYVGERLTDEDKKYLEVIFRGADKDGNGRLDIKEFTAYLEKMDDDLFMGQAGALGKLLAAANINPSVKGFHSGKGTGNSNQRRNYAEELRDVGDTSMAAAADIGGGNAAAGNTADADVNAASQLLAAATRALSGRKGGSGFSFGNGVTGLPDDLESLTSNQGGLRNSFLSKLRHVGRHRRASVSSSTIAAIAGQLASMGVTSGGRAMRTGSMSSTRAPMGHLHTEAPDFLRTVSSARTAMHPHGHTHLGAAPGLGHAPSAHFLVESSSLSTLRLASSTGQMGGFLYPEEQSPRAVLATAPVALSRKGSFGDSTTTAAAAAHGAVAPSGNVLQQHPKQHQGWPGLTGASHRGSFGTSAGVAASDVAGGSSGLSLPLYHPFPHPYPHTNLAQTSTPFHQLRSQSMSAVPPSSLVLPASLRDPDESLSGCTTSPFSPAGSGAAVGSLSSPAQERPGPGGSTGGVHVGFTGRPQGGLRSPAASWQMASVIQEAPEEGDSGYGGLGSGLGRHPQEQEQNAVHFEDLPMRNSAPTRFGRLASFPTRISQLQQQSESRAIRSSGDDGGGGLLPARPMRLGSAGEGRFGYRIGGLMAAMFSRQRSVEQGGSEATTAVAASPRSSFGTVPNSIDRPSPYQAQLPLTQSSSRNATQSGGGNDRRSPLPSNSSGASSSWGFAASAKAAIGWLRRARSLGVNWTAANSGDGTSGGDGDQTYPGQQPAAPEVTAATNAIMMPPSRLTVEVPRTNSLSSFKLTSPGDVALNPDTVSGPGPAASGALSSAGTIADASSMGSNLQVPFDSSAAATIAAGVVPTLPPVVMLERLIAAPGSGLGPASESGLPTQVQPPAQDVRPLPSSSSQVCSVTRSPNQVPTPIVPQYGPPGSPQSPASLAGSSPRQALSLMQPQTSPMQVPSISHLAEPPAAAKTSPPPGWPPPLPRLSPPPLAVTSGSPRAAAAVVLSTRGVLHRSGSAGGSSRLAVSSARDSPPAASTHMLRQQSLQQQTQAHSPTAASSVPSPHRLNQQGLPPGSTFSASLIPRAPQLPHDLDSQTPLPHRLSHTGPHGAPLFQHNQSVWPNTGSGSSSASGSATASASRIPSSRRAAAASATGAGTAPHGSPGAAVNVSTASPQYSPAAERQGHADDKFATESFGIRSALALDSE